MKRLFAMICAVLMLTAVLSGCMTETEKKVKDTASEAASGLKKAATEMGIDDNETRRNTSTENEYTTESDMGEMIEDAVDSMIDNGEVEDGDGNIGDAENRDGDRNVDENAPDHVSAVNE